MKCPRCGAEMSGGICNSCGFPMNKKNARKAKGYYMFFLAKNKNK